MSKIAYVYLAVLPYLNVAAVFYLLDNEFKGRALIVFFVVLALSLLVGAAMNVVYNLGAAASQKNLGFAVRNLVLKLIHIPVHLLVLLIVAGFMNPFLLLASWIPALFGVGLLIFDGFANIGACVGLYVRKKCGLLAAVVLAFASFIYVVDLIAAIVQIVKSKNPQELYSMNSEQ